MADRDWYCEDVLSGDTVVEKVWEDDLVMAFHHPRPLTDMHIVVIPKSHIESILSLNAEHAELLMSMMSAVQHSAKSTGLDSAGFYVRTNIGTVSQGVTPHMHWHIIGPGIPDT